MQTTILKPALLVMAIAINFSVLAATNDQIVNMANNSQKITHHQQQAGFLAYGSQFQRAIQDRFHNYNKFSGKKGKVK